MLLGGFAQLWIPPVIDLAWCLTRRRQVNCFLHKWTQLPDPQLFGKVSTDLLPKAIPSFSSAALAPSARSIFCTRAICGGGRVIICDGLMEKLLSEPSLPCSFTYDPFLLRAESLSLVDFKTCSLPAPVGGQEALLWEYCFFPADFSRLLSLKSGQEMKQSGKVRSVWKALRMPCWKTPSSFLNCPTTSKECFAADTQTSGSPRRESHSVLTAQSCVWLAGGQQRTSARGNIA